MPRLQLVPDPDWPSLGWDLIDWIESELCHGPGDVEGDPIELDDELARFIVDCYRLYPKGHEKAGQRAVRRATLSRPKGRAKSELAGMLVCAEAVAPVRFDGWRANGEPQGRPVRSPFIRCLATAGGQTGNTYANVELMLAHAKDRSPKALAGVDVGSTRVLLPGKGEIRPSTSGSSSKDGGKETFAVADEIHLYTLPELRQLLATVRRNLRKRKLAEPWLLQTTTMYRPGQNSPAETEIEAARKEVGKPARDPSVLLDHIEAEKIRDWADDEEMLAALVYVYESAAAWMPLDGILSEIRDPETDRGDAERYFFNRRAEFADQAFDLEQWDGCEHAGWQPEKGDLIVVGFDGARYEDSTALVGCSVETGVLFLLGLWEKPEGEDDWQVDEDAVRAAVAETFERFEVWRMYADPPYWESTVSFWQGQHGDKRVLDWHTNRRRQVAYSCRSFQTSIRAGEVGHDGDPDLRRHIGNAYREDLPRIKDDKGKAMWMVRKERAGSPRKIDAAMAGILAWEARMDAVAAGVKKKRGVPRRIR